MLLKDIATIKVGATNGRYGNSVSKGRSIKTLLSVAIKNHALNSEYVDEIHLNRKGENKDLPITKEGDILIKLNPPFETILINKSEEDYLVPICYCIVRCNTKKDSKYIFSILSNQYIQDKISDKERITVERIKNISLPNIDEKLKETIGDLYCSSVDEQQILHRIINNRILEIDNLIYKKVYGGK